MEIFESDVAFCFCRSFTVAYVGIFIDDAVFRQVMASIIFLSTGIMVFNERYQSQMISQNWLLIAGLGIAAGFTTMV